MTQASSEGKNWDTHYQFPLKTLLSLSQLDYYDYKQLIVA